MERQADLRLYLKYVSGCVYFFFFWNCAPRNFAEKSACGFMQSTLLNDAAPVMSLAAAKSTRMCSTCLLAAFAVRNFHSLKTMPRRSDSSHSSHFGNGQKRTLLTVMHNTIAGSVAINATNRYSTVTDVVLEKDIFAKAFSARS
jgi:hypothetical protein